MAGVRMEVEFKGGGKGEGGEEEKSAGNGANAYHVGDSEQSSKNYEPADTTTQIATNSCRGLEVFCS